MRINLVTPFADKDKAKALGARWDAVRKLWYIVDVADLTPFMRWIPDLDAATRTVVAAAGVSIPASARPVAAVAKPAVITRPIQEVTSCGCQVLPWEPCAHSTAGL
jgi:hypothetical protein